MSSTAFDYTTDMMLVIDTALGTTVTNNNVFRLPVGEAAIAAFIQNGLFAGRFVAPSPTAPGDNTKIWPDTNSNPTVYKYWDGAAWSIADWYDIWDISASLAGTEVNATSTFGTDNLLLRSDGTVRNIQTTGISIDDSNNMSGVVNLTLTGDVTVGGTVDGRDLAADGTKLDLLTITGAVDLDLFSTAVTAGAFGVDNQLLRSHGSGRVAQATTITVDDSDNMSGVVNLTLTGDIAVGGTVDGRDIATDGATLDSIATVAVLETDTNLSGSSFFLDEDNLASNSDTKVPSQQSVKAYVDTNSLALTTTDLSSAAFFLDEDEMASDDATKVPSQQSVKAYVDASVSDAGGGNVSATVNFGTGNRLVVSDGVVKNIKHTGVSIDSSDNLTLPGATATLGASGADFDIQHVAATRNINIHGGTGAGTGASLLLYGESHATLPGDYIFNNPAGNAVYAYDHSANTHSFASNATAIADINGSGIDLATGMALSVSGIDIISDTAGTATLSNIDAIDATTEATIETAIDTLNNLVSATSLATLPALNSIQNVTVTLADAGADALFGWDDSASAYVNLSASDARTVLNVENGADVTDATNVAAAGAVMNTGDETIAGVKTFSADPLIPDEAYGVGWNGSLEPPTKNAVYDKVETLSAGGITSDNRLLELVTADSVTGIVGLIDAVADGFNNTTGIVDGSSSNYSVADGVLKPTRQAGANALPTFTSNTSGSITLSGSTAFSADYDFWKASDGDDNTWYSTTVAVPTEWKVDFGSGNTETIAKFAHKNYTASFYNIDLDVEGSNDDSAWDTLLEIRGEGHLATLTEVDLTTTGAYRYYRVIVSARNGANSTFRTIQMLRFGTVDNMTAVSESFTASSAPSEINVSAIINPVDATTLNTDYTIEVSRDGGTTWTSATLAKTADLEGGTDYLEAAVDVSAQPSGTSIKYRVKTLNNTMVETKSISLRWS